MTKAKKFFATILVVGNILFHNSCTTSTKCAEEPPSCNAGNDTTISLSNSGIILSGSYSQNVGCSEVIDVRWESHGPTAVTIESDTSLITNVTGLTQAGTYVFILTCRYFYTSHLVNGYKFTTYYNVSCARLVTVSSAETTPNNFKISPNIYTVQTIKNIDGFVSARSFRNATDSGTITFYFLNDAAIPSPGSAGDFKVVKLVSNTDEVRVNAVRTTGNNGTVYDCIGTDSVKAHVSVNANGKISIKMPDALAKRLLVKDTVKVSADFFEP